MYKYVEDMSSKQSGKIQRTVEITHVAGRSNRKMSSMCKEHTEQGGGTENQIREEVSVHRFYRNCNGKPFWEGIKVT